MQLAAISPDRANAMVRDLTSGDGTWDRALLVEIVGARLTDIDRAELATTSQPDRLVELMRSAGVLAPATMIGVLHAEHVDAETVAALVPAIGLPTPDAIRTLHHDWHVDRVEAGAALGATADELRSAGCTPAEMLAAAPREELRRLDTREHTWELVGPTLLEAGYTHAEAVAHLAAHAPNPATFAAGVTAIIDDPVAAFVYARDRADADDLVALSECYELAPSETASALRTAACSSSLAAEVLAFRCNGDTEEARRLMSDTYGPEPTLIQPQDVAVVPRPDIDHDATLAGVGVEL